MPTTNRKTKPRSRPRAKPALPAAYLPGSLAWCFSHWPGGPTEVVLCLQEEAMTLPPDDPRLERVTRFIACWLGCAPKARANLRTLDWACQQVGLRPKDFFSLVTARAFEMKAEIMPFLEATMLPRILATSYEAALNPEHGFADRHALLQASGHHHAPQGSNINIDNRTLDVTVQRGLPDFDETVHRLHDALNEADEPLQLTTPLPAMLIEKEAVDAEVS